MPTASARLDRLELERFVARDDHGAGNRRQVARLAALLVVLDELVDLLADDLPLVGLFARGDAALEQVPVDLAGRRRRLLPLAANRLAVFAVVEHLEPDELVDVAGGQGGLVELHAELLHPNRGDADHRQSCPVRYVGPAPAGHNFPRRFYIGAGSAVRNFRCRGRWRPRFRIHSESQGGWQDGRKTPRLGFPPGLPPGDQAVFPNRAEQHEQREQSQGEPRLPQRQRVVKRKREQPVDHLHVNPVDKERRTAELLERAPSFAAGRPLLPGVRNANHRDQKPQPQEEERRRRGPEVRPGVGRRQERGAVGQDRQDDPARAETRGSTGPR